MRLLVVPSARMSRWNGAAVWVPCPIRLCMSSPTGKLVNDLNYLAVWREEKGKWRFLAWQSCKNPPPGDAKK